MLKQGWWLSYSNIEKPCILGDLQWLVNELHATQHQQRRHLS